MGKKSVKKNYIYNLIYQLFAIITPLIVTPYISRVLGTAGVGQYSFTYSIVSYFVLFAALGFGYYAQREIAREQGNKVNQSKIFFEIMIAKWVTVSISIIIYIVVILTGIYGETYTKLMWILLINIGSVAFDVSFVFQGNEDFGVIALRDVAIKVIGVVLILIFVKNESHVWLYALCLSVSLIVSSLSLWTRLPKYITRVKVSELHVKRHIIPTLRLFIPTIAVQVYTMLDKTLIGVMINGTVTVDGVEKNISDIENGYYDLAEKMVKMAMTIVTSLGTVMSPRNSQAIASGDEEGFKRNVSSALKFLFLLGTPIMFGLAAVSLNFAPWFFGDDYGKIPYLMMILSPLVMIIGLSNILGIQYLLPKKEDKKYTIAITSGAVINLLLNLVTIYFFWSYGAAIATVIAEIIVTSIMFIYAKKDIKILSILRSSWKYLLGGLLMFGGVFATQYFLGSSLLHTILLIFEGIGIYLLSLIFLRDKLLISLFNRIKNKIFKRNTDQNINEQ